MEEEVSYSASFGVWCSIVAKHLGNKMKRYVTDLIHNITAVDRKVKPSYLLDFGVSSGASLKQFIEDLKINACVSNSLNIYQIGSDYLIVNPCCIKDLQKSEDIQSKFLIVDISCMKDGPKRVQTTSSLFSDISLFIQKLPINVENVELFDVETSLNLTTVFGVLLVYPFVYWFDDTSEQNCLSMEPLKCFEVAQTLKTSTESVNFKDNCKIFSFTIPDRLFDHEAQGIFERWIAKQRCIDQSLIITSKLEVLPVVAL